MTGLKNSKENLVFDMKMKLVVCVSVQFSDVTA